MLLLKEQSTTSAEQLLYDTHDMVVVLDDTALEVLAHELKC